MKFSWPVCFLLSMILYFPNTVCGQVIEKPSTREIPKQSVYAELFGNGLLYSLNYDVFFNNGYGVRLGGSFISKELSEVFGNRGPYRDIDEKGAFTGLVMGHRMIGSGPGRLELGAGLIFGSIYNPRNWQKIRPPAFTFTAGYRLYPVESGKVTFKAAFTPVLTHQEFFPRVGISLGFTLTPEGNRR